MLRERQNIVGVGGNQNFPAEDVKEHADAAGIVHALENGELFGENPRHQLVLEMRLSAQLAHGQGVRDMPSLALAKHGRISLGRLVVNRTIWARHGNGDLMCQSAYCRTILFDHAAPGKGQVKSTSPLDVELCESSIRTGRNPAGSSE